MNKEYFYSGSLRLTRFLFSLGFNYDEGKIFDKNGKERWRFRRSPELIEAYTWFKYMRNKVKNNESIS